ncbi:hypothetical protein CAEBREN_25022 [Caenorhabditis brenneri]|uniref:Uncharacterized protein n=1 Tax=Caenorhabditis brenneri TaxID=135651 RepID=G0MMW2_CAEBE|nr:hypothetical protein CAEBREN_25022 [Caenorhabditis brenneri]
MNFSILIVLLLAATLSAKLTKEQQRCEDMANLPREYNTKKSKSNRLEYDEQLEAAAKKEKHSCAVSRAEEIKKDEMYSTFTFSEFINHPLATKVACITVYCDNYKSEQKIYIVEKGPSEAIDSCPSGRTVDVKTGLCVASVANLRASNNSRASNVIGIFLILIIYFI